MFISNDTAVTIIVMGVCGSGKTTFGSALGKRIGAVFIEGDDLHPQANIDKMSEGIPLEDTDRWPWLQSIRQRCETELQQGSIVVSCSALKKAYRDALREISGEVFFIHMVGDKKRITQRMSGRPDHFMPTVLIESQFNTLEHTENEEDVMSLDITISLTEQLGKIPLGSNTESINLKTAPHLALVGLGVMGGNLADNIIANGYQLNTCELNPDLRQQFIDARPDTPCHASLTDLITSMTQPRCIFLLIKAGDPVDQVINALLPLLQHQDIIVDLGNSHYKDTDRRCALTAVSSIRFVGCGISGGAEGARHGPALMPGGDKSCYPLLKTFFSDIAAKYDGAPCVTWTSTGGAGHFVKMVHNGIEYADMQLIAESYQIMRDGLGMEAAEISDVFDRWNNGPLASYLIEATAQIFKATEKDGAPLIDRILDKAGQKGTGGWATEAALEYGVPATLITDAVFARVMSSQKTARIHYATKFPGDIERKDQKTSLTIAHLETALYAAKVINYVQGFMLMTEVSNARNWKLNLRDIASIWRAGCIIRGRLLDDIVAAYESVIHYSLLDAPSFADTVQQGHPAIREVLHFSLNTEIPTPAYSSAVTFFDSLRSVHSSANLIQAQRDYFGAHTFERTDQPDGQFFHADWNALIDNSK